LNEEIPLKLSTNLSQPTESQSEERFSEARSSSLSLSLLKEDERYFEREYSYLVLKLIYLFLVTLQCLWWDLHRHEIHNLKKNVGVDFNHNEYKR
jgi:hypothetical protein